MEKERGFFFFFFCVQSRARYILLIGICNYHVGVGPNWMACVSQLKETQFEKDCFTNLCVTDRDRDREREEAVVMDQYGCSSRRLLE